uniref:ABC transporter domain-containing protein n=1 Tax=Parastrongyloides trichosuri TaxID=131310 RepID=A0A0N5A1Q6_PARTI
MFLAIKQLSILLKKIWIQRWRRKAFTFVEMVIPLFMFIILTIIRHSMTSDVKSHCHYDAKGLPSAGIQPTMDGLTQSYDNKCRVLETSGGDSRYINNKILRSNLSYIGEGVLNLLKFVGSRENFTLNTKDTITFLRKIEYINNNSKVDYFSTNSNFYKNIKELRIYLYDFYKSKGLSGFKNLKNLMFKLPKVSKKKNKKIIDKEWYDGYEILLKNIVDTLNLDNFVRERLEKTRNSEKTVCGGFKIPGFKNCSYYKYLTEITSRIKPLAAGYILITPQNNKTEKIYEYFTSLFSKLHDIVEYIKYFKENEDVIKYVLNQSDINQILEKIIILLTKMSENDEFGENNDVSDSFRLLLLIFEHAKNYGSYTDQIVDILSNEIGEIIENALPCLYFDRVRFVKNETDMEEKALCLQNYNMYYTGIVLHNTSTLEKVLLNSNQKLNTTNSIVYSMRPLNSIIDTGRKVFSKGHVRNMPRDDFNYDLKYITSGYIYFQDIIDRILIEDKIKMKLPDIGIFIQQEPSSCTLPATPFDVSHNVSLCIICSFIFTFGILVKNVCTEKETHIVDMMYIHGLPEILHYMAYWLDTIFLNSIICAIISTMLVYGEILVSVSFWAILVPLILYIITTTSQAIILCNIVTNSNYGAALMAFIYLMSFLPSALHIIGEPGFTYVFLLLPQSTVSSLLEIYINSYVGNYYFFEIFNDLYLYTGLQFSHTCYFLLGDTILYTMIAFIIIPLLKKLKYTRFWACIVQKVLFFRKNLETDEIYLSIIEEPNENDVRTVHIDNLVLKYPNGVYGLRGATMSFYNNQITAFLGHNGAGKSSLVKVLSGMEKASSGFARIYGKDLRYDINEIRRMIGICPQDNVLFPYLSVIEHFTFFGGLMNIPKAILCSEIEVILHDTGLSYKRYCLASDLSGGMKRKLCMGIALLGDSKLIILDEPTSGVDPLQRKSIWDLIFKIKKGRTVILSTHYMDEAEILGDRIVVMNNGMVCAEGTIQFLKEQLNNEIIIKIKNICIENCNDSEFENVMNQYCFIEKKTPLYKYYRVLKDKMETVKDLLNYLNINVSDVCEDYQIYLPDFQDFFLKLCRKNNHSTDTEPSNNTSTEDVTKDVFGLKHPKYEEVTNKCKLFWIRYFVLLKKKYKIFKNDIILELITRLFPLLTIILALAYQAAVRSL